MVKKPNYCGNNKLYPDLLKGKVKLGTRFECLQKGIQIGKKLGPDPKYSGKYEPIDTRKIYCGNKSELPEGYSYIGNAPLCLQKGTGIGKRLVSKFTSFVKDNKIIFKIFCYILIITLSFLYLYIKKPLYITDKLNNKRVINWKNFVLVYLFILLLSCIIFI